MKLVLLALCILAAISTARLEIASPGSSLSLEERTRICLQQSLQTNCMSGVYYAGHGVCLTVGFGCVSRRTFQNFAECHSVCNGLPNDPPCDPPTKTTPNDCRLTKIFVNVGCPEYFVDCPERQPTIECPELQLPPMDVASFVIRNESGCDTRIIGLNGDN